MALSREETVPIWEKYALNMGEAQKYFNIGKDKLRQIVNENHDVDFVLQYGNRFLIKREKFIKYLDVKTTI
ncbi:MAG: transposase [Clostridiales bacterium]|nr:transposase [Clostridiales bacterium]